MTPLTNKSLWRHITDSRVTIPHFKPSGCTSDTHTHTPLSWAGFTQEIKERIVQNHWVQYLAEPVGATDWVNCRTVRALQEVCWYSLLLRWVSVSSSELDPEPTDELSWLSGSGSVRKPLVGLGVGRGLRERAHALTTLWLDELPHLQRDPVAPPAETVTLIMWPVSCKASHAVIRNPKTLQHISRMKCSQTLQIWGFKLYEITSGCIVTMVLWGRDLTEASVLIHTGYV